MLNQLAEITRQKGELELIVDELNRKLIDKQRKMKKSSKPIKVNKILIDQELIEVIGGKLGRKLELHTP